jgi:hypothetical protein
MRRHDAIEDSFSHWFVESEEYQHFHGEGYEQFWSGLAIDDSFRHIERPSMRAGQRHDAIEGSFAYWFVESEEYQRVVQGEGYERFWSGHAINGSFRLPPEEPRRTALRNHIRARLRELRLYAADFK